MKTPAASPSDPEAGFVLFEVLIATALLAFAGTTILIICNSALSNADVELDRSVALVRAEGLSHEIAAFGSRAIPTRDELYRYELVIGDQPTSAPSMVAASIAAVPLDGDGRRAVSLDLLLRRSIAAGG